MPANQITCYEIRCDHCNDTFDDGEGLVAHFDSAEEGFERAADIDEWTTVRGGRIYCDKPRCLLAAPSCECEDTPLGGRCDGDMCDPGCPCLLHSEIGPIPPCTECGYQATTTGEEKWHWFKHQQIGGATV